MKNNQEDQQRCITCEFVLLFWAEKFLKDPTNLDIRSRLLTLPRIRIVHVSFLFNFQHFRIMGLPTMLIIGLSIVPNFREHYKETCFDPKRFFWNEHSKGFLWEIKVSSSQGAVRNWRLTFIRGFSPRGWKLTRATQNMLEYSYSQFNHT